MNYPIIRLEVEGMKNVVKVALTEQAARMDADIQAAVDLYCTPENIGNIIRAEASRQIDEAVRQSVKDFFGWGGNGRIAVREAVNEFLDDRYPLKKEGSCVDENRR